jgi:hypothetical protein
MDKKKDNLIMNLKFIALNINPIVHKHAKMNKRVSYTDFICLKSSFRTWKKMNMKWLGPW